TASPSRGGYSRAARPSGRDMPSMPPRSDAPWGRVRPSEVGLPDAIHALSRVLDQAWRDAQQQGLHFAVGPVELTIHVAPSHVSGGIEWRVLQVDEQASPQRGGMHTLTMRFLPQPALDISEEDREK